MILEVSHALLDKLLPWIYYSQLPDIRAESAHLDQGEGEVRSTQVPEDHSELSDSNGFIFF